MKNIFPALFLWLFPIFILAQEKLGYTLKTDDVFMIKQEANQVIIQELDGAQHEITNYINGLLEFRVLGEQEDNYRLALTFKDLNLRMTSSIQGELMNVSAKEVDEGNIQSQIFNSLLDHPVEMTLSKNGDILEVKGGDSLVSKMAQASGLQDEFSLNMMKKSLEKEFGSEALSNSYEQMTYIYPDSEVRAGDTWKNEFSGKLSARNTWTLDTLTEETVEISGTATVTMDIKEASTSMDLTGTQDTKITADKSTGFIQKMKVEGLSEGTGTMAQLGDQKIPTTIKSTVTYELINN